MSTGEDIAAHSVGTRFAASAEQGTEPPEAVSRATHTDIPGNWVVELSWNDISTGDCTMIQIIVYVYEDGTIYFVSQVGTTSPGDVWIIRWIQFYDNQGSPVGEPVGKHDGPRMDGAHTFDFAFWDAIPGVTPTSVTQIAKATIQNHC